MAAPHTGVDVMVIVERSDGSILLTEEAAGAEEAGRGGGPAVLRLPGGRTGPGESVVDAAARALYAGTGIRAEPDGLRLVHVMQHRGESGQVRIGWFLAATPWPARTPSLPASGAVGGAPGTGPAWYRPDRLPDHTDGYDALGIAHYLKGEPFSVHGW